jgi:hypothetical protein
MAHELSGIRVHSIVSARHRCPGRRAKNVEFGLRSGGCFHGCPG